MDALWKTQNAQSAYKHTSSACLPFFADHATHGSASSTRPPEGHMGPCCYNTRHEAVAGANHRLLSMPVGRGAFAVDKDLRNLQALLTTVAANGNAH
jgi:hypothetical protein